MSIGIGLSAASGFARALAADGFDSPGSLDSLSLDELREEFGFMRGHCRMVEQSRGPAATLRGNEGGASPAEVVVLAALAQDEDLPSPAPAPMEGSRALGSLQLLHEAAMAAEQQRREVLEADLRRAAADTLRTHAEKVGATEAVAAATAQMKALEQEYRGAVAACEQRLAQAQAALAGVEQELRREKLLREASDARAQVLEVEVEGFRTHGETLKFAHVAADGGLLGPWERIKTPSPGSMFVEGATTVLESIERMPGEYFVADRLSNGSVTVGDNFEQEEEHVLLTNYGRTMTTAYRRGRKWAYADSKDGLTGHIQPLSEEYLELAQVMRGCNGGWWQLGDYRSFKNDVGDNALIGMMQVYRKYHPSAAEQFKARSDGV